MIDYFSLIAGFSQKKKGKEIEGERQVKDRVTWKKKRLGGMKEKKTLEAVKET